MVHAGAFYWGDVMWKNIENKRAWHREYNKRNPDKVRKWNENDRIKRAKKHQVYLADMEAAREQKRIAAIPVEVAKACDIIRRRIMVRDGLAKCWACGEIKNREDVIIHTRPGSVTGRCRECASKASKAWTKANRHILAQRMRKQRARNRLNPSRFLKDRIRDRLSHAIKKSAKGFRVTSSMDKYLGCTLKQLSTYIESQFIGCMTWENYGRAWHIDHVFPLAGYDFTREDDLKKALHYTNMRPLWAKTNCKKSDKQPDKPYQPRLILA
jgi:hypothetical protein